MYLFYVTILIVININGSETKLNRNVLFIFVDDLRPLVDENINLPNIQNMAANGISFENAFAQQALCAPSRNSILTGRRPDALHLYDFYSYWRTFIGNFTTLPQYFKQNGYETYSIGKVFHPGQSSNFNDDYPYSWSHVPYHPPTDKYKEAAVCKDRRTQRMQKNLICPVKVSKQPGKSLPDLQSIDYAIEILKRTSNSTKPLFIAVGFHKPHIPLKFPRKYLDQVPIEQVRLPKYPHKPAAMPLVAWHPWTDVRQRDDIKSLNIDFPMGTMPKKWTLKIRQSYYAAALYIDDLIGKLLSYVDMKKTIIVLTSDHGWSLGENGLWAKYSNFDVALKVPLIFSIPKMAHKSLTTPVELIDIFPTLVDLAGLPYVPKCPNDTDKVILCVQGKSLLHYMNRFSEGDKHISFSISQYPRPGEYPVINSDKPRLMDINIMGYSIRTNRYRYTEWISFNNKLFTRNWNKLYGVELYDHITDPDESNNVNTNPQYKYIKIYLSKLLRSQIDPK
ncbi:iduronate 2-sulfatase [Pectinophora gossypiella]|uniref:iduronate 2-sulfatase n=1 Tax=Pectinophora gossypiella TaxID=13191 RepID=UPI00214EB64A|nr:iduronate 2-sulfatase [Pectinophora gossypiella]